MGLAATGMSITAIPGMLLYLNGQLPQYLIACAIGFVVAFCADHGILQAERKLKTYESERA